MPWLNDMPDESYVLRMIEEILETTKRLSEQTDGFDRLLRGHNGKNGLLTDISHVVRTANENKLAIEKLRTTVDALVRGRPDSELSRTKWRVFGEIVVAFSAGLALLLQFIGG